jgi:hypothetical protein
MQSHGSRKRTILIGMVAAVLLAGLAGGAYLIANIEWGPRVYLTRHDSYYFYDLCPRALSLGLTEGSPTYLESEAIEAGYKPVPPELLDTDVIAERVQRATLEHEQLVGEAQQALQEIGAAVVEASARVYLTRHDSYYFYDLCPRALSLGLTEGSPTYLESEAIEAGYKPVPPELLDTDVIAERVQRATLEHEQSVREAQQALQEIEAALVEASARMEQANVEDLQRFTREVVLNRVDHPARTAFLSFRWREGPGPNTYTVQWGLSPTKAWQLEVRDCEDYWRLIYCDEVRGSRIWR